MDLPDLSFLSSKHSANKVLPPCGRMERVEHDIVKWKLEFTVLLEGPYKWNCCLHNPSYKKNKIKAGPKEMSLKTELSILVV